MLQIYNAIIKGAMDTIRNFKAHHTYFTAISKRAIHTLPRLQIRMLTHSAIWNYYDNINKSVLSYAELFYVNFKMATVLNKNLEQSVGSLKGDLSIDTTFDPP